MFANNGWMGGFTPGGVQLPTQHHNVHQVPYGYNPQAQAMMGFRLPVSHQRIGIPGVESQPMAMYNQQSQQQNR